MLSQAQAEIVWDGLLSAEIRAQYFAALSVSYLRLQKFLVAGSLILSSGASVTLLSSVVPVQYSWVKAALTLATAACSAATLVMKNERNAIECSDLHFRWNTLAMGYQNLWVNTASDDAQEILERLRSQEAQVSKSSTVMPEKAGMLSKAQDNVIMHHREIAA